MSFSENPNYIPRRRGVEGIQKRLERVLNREELERQLREFLERRVPAPVDSPEIQARLREPARGGPYRRPQRGLERQREALERQLAYASASRAPDGRSVEQIVQTLLERLGGVRSTLGDGGPEERKAVVRTFHRRRLLGGGGGRN